MKIGQKVYSKQDAASEGQKGKEDNTVIDADFSET